MGFEPMKEFPLYTLSKRAPSTCLLYTSPSPRDMRRSRMPSSAWKKKIANKEDLFGRGHKYEVVELNKDFPDYILRNIKTYNDFII